MQNGWRGLAMAIPTRKASSGKPAVAIPTAAAGLEASVKSSGNDTLTKSARLRRSIQTQSHSSVGPGGQRLPRSSSVALQAAQAAEAAATAAGAGGGARTLPQEPSSFTLMFMATAPGFEDAVPSLLVACLAALRMQR